MESKQTITYPIIIEEELWNQFKGIVTKNKTLNDAIIDLIKKEIVKNENLANNGK